MQALARRWDELVRMFTGGDADIARSAASLHRGERTVAEKNGIVASLMSCVGRARARRDG